MRHPNLNWEIINPKGPFVPLKVLTPLFTPEEPSKGKQRNTYYSSMATELTGVPPLLRAILGLASPSVVKGMVRYGCWRYAQIYHQCKTVRQYIRLMCVTSLYTRTFRNPALGNKTIPLPCCFCLRLPCLTRWNVSFHWAGWCSKKTHRWLRPIGNKLGLPQGWRHVSKCGRWAFLRLPQKRVPQLNKYTSI